MKRIIAIILVIVLVFALCACGKTDVPAAETPKTEQTPAAGPEAEAPKTEEPVAPTWPNGDITFYIPQDAGAPMDVATRIVTDNLQTATGATVNIVNDGTGNGEILLQKLHDAKPDGQTLMVHGIGAILTYYKDFHAYNPGNPEDYTLVCTSLSSYAGSCLYLQKSLGCNTLEEFVAYVKAHPGEVKCSMMDGTTGELVLTQLYNKLGIMDDIRIVEANPEEIITGLIGGTIDAALWYENLLFEEGIVPVVSTRVDRNYDATVTDEMAEVLAGVPIFGEMDMAEYAYMIPMFILAPAGTPDEICEQIAAAMNTILDNPEAVERIAAIHGDEYHPYTVQETRDVIYSTTADIEAMEK